MSTEDINTYLHGLSRSFEFTNSVCTEYGLDEATEWLLDLKSSLNDLLIDNKSRDLDSFGDQVSDDDSFDMILSSDEDGDYQPIVKEGVPDYSVEVKQLREEYVKDDQSTLPNATNFDEQFQKRELKELSNLKQFSKLKIPKINMEFYDVKQTINESAWIQPYLKKYEYPFYNVQQELVNKIKQLLKENKYQEIIDNLKQDELNHPFLIYWFHEAHIKLIDQVKVIEVKETTSHLKQVFKFTKIYDKMFLSLCTLAKGDIEKDSESRTKYYSAYDHPFVLYLLGLLASKSSNIELAHAYLTLSIHRFPTNWLAWKTLGEVINTKEQFVDMFTKLPNSFCKPFFHMIVATKLCIPYSQVVDAYQFTSTLFKDSNYLIIFRAFTYYMNYEYEKAEHYFSFYFNQNENSLKNAELYALILVLLNEEFKLAQFNIRCLKINKESATTLCVLGYYHSLKNEKFKSIKLFRHALLKQPDSNQAWFALAREYEKIGMKKKARECFALITSLYPNDYRAWFALAKAYQREDYPLAALAAYKKVIMIRPNNLLAWNEVAQVSESLGDFTTMVQAYEQLTKSDNTSRLAHFKLAYSYLKQSNHIGDEFSCKTAYHFYHALDLKNNSEFKFDLSDKHALRYLIKYSVYVKDKKATKDYLLLLSKVPILHPMEVITIKRSLPIEYTLQESDVKSRKKEM